MVTLTIIFRMSSFIIQDSNFMSKRVMKIISLNHFIPLAQLWQKLLMCLSESAALSSSFNFFCIEVTSNCPTHALFVLGIPIPLRFDVITVHGMLVNIFSNDEKILCSVIYLSTLPLVWLWSFSLICSGSELSSLLQQQSGRHF